MGEDYLVYVKGTGFILNFTEHYRRFRYQDIQALSVTRTSRGGKITLHLSGLLVCAGSIGLIINGAEGGLSTLLLVTLSIFSAGTILFLCLFLRNLMLGPTCFCDLRTNLKTERIVPLNRLHLANQAIDVLGEVIGEKQKHLETDAEPAKVSLSRLAKAEQDRLSIGKTVFPAFLDYAIFGLVALAALHLESIALCATGLVLVVLGNMMLFRSLVRSFRFATPAVIRRLLFVLLTAVMVFGGLAMVYFVDIVSKNTLFLQTVTGPFEAFAGIPNLGGMVYYLLFLAATLFILVPAVAGLFQVLKWRKRLREDSPPIES